MKSVFKSLVLSAAATVATYAVIAWLDADNAVQTSRLDQSDDPEVDADNLDEEQRDSMLAELESQL